MAEEWRKLAEGGRGLCYKKKGKKSCLMAM